MVRCKDGSEHWVPLKSMKEHFPVQTAEFAKSRGIHDEPDFACWVPFTLRKRDGIISAVKCRVTKLTHEYGTEVPMSIEHAIEINKKNGNRFWQEAIELEMKNVAVAFEILEDGSPAPVG